MREIKFRAWDTVRKKMFSAYEMGQDQEALLPDGRGFANISSTSTRLTELHSHLIPLQYTGLKDKSSIEIYEGDIVRFIEHGHLRVGSVVFDEEHGCWSVRFKFGNLDPMTIMMMSQGLNDFEVIGNLCENPELIETEGK